MTPIIFILMKLGKLKEWYCLAPTLILLTMLIVSKQNRKPLKVDEIKRIDKVLKWEKEIKKDVELRNSYKK